VQPSRPDLVDTLSVAILSYIAEGPDAARMALEPIRMSEAEIVSFPRFKLGWVPGGQRKIGNPRLADIVAAYRRDSFTCLYCGARLIAEPVLFLFSAALPADFPADRTNWKRERTHPAMWYVAPQADHRLAGVGKDGCWDHS